MTFRDATINCWRSRVFSASEPPSRPGQVDGEPGCERQGACGLAEGRLETAHRGGDGCAKAV